MSASGESSTTMHRILHASGSHPIPTPYDPKRSTCWFLAQDHLLNHSVKAKRCRIHLFKRHRFAIAISKYHLLVNSSLRLDFFLYNVASSLASESSIDWFYCRSLLIDDITADVIYA
ncbi:hypothetical protein F511_21313 [Dorcoceras hygrometricum]|uniref:Uncharacterized protein n=1 Tax=Dorcoceras hygrometricum TaxID=472368 RepID=A0A2Z7B745_9LAMI|nr:hypothetical protein F511_21313 [Dorcoceras hygrometricum]